MGNNDIDTFSNHGKITAYIITELIIITTYNNSNSNDDHKETYNDSYC